MYSMFERASDSVHLTLTISSGGNNETFVGLSGDESFNLFAPIIMSNNQYK